MNISKALRRSFVLVLSVELLVSPAFSQLSGLDHERAEAILEGVASDIRKEYYDPKFHGVDWDGKVADAKTRIAKASSWEAAMIEIAVLTDELSDSHTTFIPPHLPSRTDYGWRFQIIGDRCYVTHVRPQSDAEAKGLKPGDQVLTLDGVHASRANLARINYAVEVLSPQAKLHVDLKTRAGSTHPVDVAARVKQPNVVRELEHPYGIDQQFYRLGWEDAARRRRPRIAELGSEAMVLKLPSFFLSESDVGKIASQARKHQALMVDLRDDPGGAEESLQYLLGSVFDHEVRIADRLMRSKTLPLKTRSHHEGFKGRLIVLVDSSSSSAAELFARTVQIEKRGMVLGDRTSGLVMEARGHPRGTGLPPIYYATMITEADLIMTDGKSLEHVGVIPDETVLPTPADLADGRDPVLARAAELAGVKLTVEDAGKLFPYEWPGD